MMGVYLVLSLVCAVIAVLSLERAFRVMKERYTFIFGAAFIAAAVFFMLWVINTSPVSDLLNYDARQTPYYQDAIDGTPSAMLAYCDNGPRYFGDCLARLELVATVTAQARLDR